MGGHPLAVVGGVEHYVSARYRRQRNRTLRRLVLWVIGSSVLYVVAVGLVGMTVRVASLEMKPTIDSGDRLLALRTGPRRIGGVPRRGDLVLVRPPDYPQNGVVTAVIEPLVRFFTLNRVSLIRHSDGHPITPVFVRRVVAVPGDAVQMRDFVAFITSPGEPSRSEYDLMGPHGLALPQNFPNGWDELQLPFGGAAPQRLLGEGQYFLLCDDRSCAADSRVWGAVGQPRIVATVAIRFWPLRRLR